MTKIFLIPLFLILLITSAHSRELPETFQHLKVVGEVDSGWEYWLLKQETCGSADECELYKRSARDTYLRILYLESDTPGDSEAKSFFDVAPATDQISEWLHHSDRDNQAWLASRIEENGWFTVSEYGEDADMAAFLIVQHADFDRPFQRTVLSLLEELLEDWDTAPSSWAMLHDRLSVADGVPQRFGSQGRCVEKNVWEPWEIADSENLSALRTKHGLMAMSKYKERLNKRCANFSKPSQ